ncbi:TraR/DksA C4-type zinc finger protein [Sediminimonas sp.]|uniref:TraR/DksA family transcriptional regulator n=1 Tax=Sediminimonas sp. TaxID=2823379 RepID=UPI0025FEA66F|nr:TraR/DksA C4-type zinc finger protein [Sediminimonas sp.]
MDNESADRFRALIEARLAALQEGDDLGAQGQQVVTLDQQATGRLSRMDALQMQAMSKAAQTRRDGETRRLRAALVRLDEGEYGHCMDCGEPIAPRRLELDPAAPRCISCAAG